jgi:hypothetical protein
MGTPVGNQIVRNRIMVNHWPSREKNVRECVPVGIEIHRKAGSREIKLPPAPDLRHASVY